MAEPVEISRKFIDVEKLVASKNPHLLKVIPSFIIAYLKRIIHQDFVNESIYRHRELFGLPFVEAVLKDFEIRIEIENQDHFAGLAPFLTSARYIVAANHPLGGLDGLALLHVIGKVRPDVVFPVNDLLMNLPGLKPLFIPINKHGRNAENLAIIDQTFASGKVILYFPAGLVSRKHRSGVIRDLDWKKTVVSKARKYQRDILPVFISGRNSDFFYNLANWRKRLGIKANIEMLYLPDEMTKQKNQVVRLVFGDPVPCSHFDRSKTDAEWAAWLKEQVYVLAGHSQNTEYTGING